MLPPILKRMPYGPVPTLYKARGVPLKQAVCAICVDRTRGRTRKVTLTNRVSVHLCEAHADRSFQTRRGGRDFVRTLMGVWRANDCLTLARSRALAAHLDEPGRALHPPAARQLHVAGAAPRPRGPLRRRRDTGRAAPGDARSPGSRSRPARRAGARCSAGMPSTAGSPERRSRAGPATPFARLETRAPLRPKAAIPA